MDLKNIVLERKDVKLIRRGDEDTGQDVKDRVDAEMLRSGCVGGDVKEEDVK